MTPRRYWIHDLHGYANQYIVGLSHDDAGGAAFQAAEYRQISKREAITAACYRGDDATEAMIGYRMGKPDEPSDKRRCGIVGCLI